MIKYFSPVKFNSRFFDKFSVSYYSLKAKKSNQNNDQFMKQYLYSVSNL